MGSQLQQVLRSLCFNTNWKYAVFWKLKHQERMIFMCEDCYYDSSQSHDKVCFNETSGISNDRPFSQDPLELAVAKMPHQVYSFAEGIIGQVAVSGKHSWIFSDFHATDPSYAFEYFGGWQLQFSAGIKTIAVVAVIPLGVVQLGSLHRVAEDMSIINHIRNVFDGLLDSLDGSIPSSLLSNMETSCLSDLCPRFSDSADFHYLDSRFQEHGSNSWSQCLSSSGSSKNHSHNLSIPYGFSNKTPRTKMNEKPSCLELGNAISLPLGSEMNLTTRYQEEGLKSHFDAKHGVEKNDLSLLGKVSELNNSSVPSDSSMVVMCDLPLEILDSPGFQDHGEFHVPKPPTVTLRQDFGKNPEQQMKFNDAETKISSFSFCAGYELYEALGASLQKQNDCAWGAEKTDCDMTIEISEGMDNNSLMMENSDMHLLDAVVAKISHKEDIIKNEKSCYDPEESLLTEKTACPSVGTISSAGYSLDQDASNSLNSVTCGVESFKVFPSTNSSRGSEYFDESQESVKTNKKRARPGESCRPRPRDRQLIQDRIKELRELVPNGSKCSIDSLLERTIKHMLFLQSITKHAEKLYKCSASKLLDKDAGMHRFSSCEQGSSWAMEVGSNPKVCPIIVENMNMNGQMLVEILCEEWNQFLDVAEIIRNLNLNILKGVSEAHGNKTWMCFVVEGQSNRNMHRMDVLWSLMQLLHPKVAN